MILVDTSIWIDHMRLADPRLDALLRQGLVLTHPLVVGELAMGSLKPRLKTLDHLSSLPSVTIAEDHEVLHFVSLRRIHGLGIGYIDAHLLASAQIVPNTSLWTKDVRLRNVAARLSLSFTPLLS